MKNTVYLVHHFYERFDAIVFESKEKAIQYACKMQKLILETDEDAQPRTKKQIKAFYTKCADGECHYSLNNLFLKKVKIVLDK